jgi:hypothetical protein
MFVTIIGVNGTRQTIGNATGFECNLSRNTASVNFFDAQGDHSLPFELNKVESITWEREPEGSVRRTNPNFVASGESV